MAAANKHPLLLALSLASAGLCIPVHMHNVIGGPERTVAHLGRGAASRVHAGANVQRHGGGGRSRHGGSKLLF
uniref:Uncharacterized protein n=1 Tax=Oryza punctata TaxID=4537 RepID=A0A0E0LUE3_ORYPU